jgi:hypothetical protein
LGLEESLCEGWLERKSGSVDGGGSDNEKWKRRYFNLLQSPDGNGNWLFAYFKDSSMSKVALVQTSYAFTSTSHKKKNDTNLYYYYGVYSLGAKCNSIIPSIVYSHN